MRIVAGLLVFSASAASLSIGAWPHSGRMCAARTPFSVKMFEEKPGVESDEIFMVPETIHPRTEARMGGTIVVTEGSGDLYASRKIFQFLHDFGKYSAIVAATPNAANAKKLVLGRAARYSGLIDILTFEEGELSASMEGADQWLALNADTSALDTQIAAAKAAGVTRAFVMLSEGGSTSSLIDVEAVTKQLEASGMSYTLMRTGRLVEGEDSERNLELSDVETAVCEDVPRSEVFRFVTEALTLTEASNRAFSLCPTEAAASLLKEMRLCGYERRDEIQALLTGVAAAQDSTQIGVDVESAAEDTPMVMRSEAEVAADREEELKMLLEKARQNGIDTQKRLLLEEKEKAAAREKMANYYKAPGGNDSTSGEDATGGSDVGSDTGSDTLSD